MRGRADPKQAIRERVWSLLESKRVTRFPGARGRIPNFVGAEACAAHLQHLEVWKTAKVIKINPDTPQRAIRHRALCEGKVLYMAVPRLRQVKCFLELDPRKIEEKRWWEASSIRGAALFGHPVALEEMSPVDLVVCGSVAVSPGGARIGKGEGYSDLEFALALETGKVTPQTPILTNVHPLQVIDEEFPWAVHDIPVDYIITPDGVLTCRGNYPRPKGIYWNLLTKEKIDAIPVLKARAHRFKRI